VAKREVRDLLRAQMTDGRFRMVDVDPASRPGLKGGKSRALKDIAKHQDVLFEWHERLYAEHKRSLLVVLQGMDTSGKDGTITHVVRNFNPQGVMITPFKAPTPEEKRHRLQEAERGGAGARFPVARPCRRPASRLHRHLQPLALRGRADRARAQPGGAGGDRAPL